MRRLTAFGERIAATEPDRQTAEIHIRIALMNRFNALGTAEIVHLARNRWDQGTPPLKSGSCNNTIEVRLFKN